MAWLHVASFRSIHRCDLTLVCSPAEVSLLAERFGVARAKLQLAPFFVDLAALPSPVRVGRNVNAREGDAAAAASREVKAGMLLSPRDERASSTFDGRFGFTTIGTFRHPPNVDGLRWLAAEVSDRHWLC